MFPISIQRPIFQCLLGLCALSINAAGAHAQNVENCGALSAPGQYGPYDYRTERGNPLSLVEGAHFKPVIENLVRGMTSVTPGPDMAYTLRAFPNHHRALIAMMRLGEKEKTPKPIGSEYTIECWFERAVQFRPDDSIVRMIYSTYLNKTGKAANASAHLDVASTYAKDNAFTHYNVGLHYFDLKNYDKALVQAHKAMELGFPQTALRDQLQSVGKWSEPVTPSDTPAAESPSSAPAK